MKKICLITPGHISSDPRLVKEASALSSKGYQIHLIFTQYMPYLIPEDHQILQDNPAWSYDLRDWSGQGLLSKINRIRVAGIQKILQLLGFNLLSASSAALGLNRNYYWQLNKAIKQCADLYLAHNLGALSIAVNAAVKTGAKCGFDAEDFHRNELRDDPNDADVRVKRGIEEKYIPALNLFTAASPEISARYRNIFLRQVTTVNNVFPKTAARKVCSNHHGPLKVFWFSQTIGPHRGIEIFMEAICISEVPVELHLLGKTEATYITRLKEVAGSAPGRVSLNLHGPVSPEEVFDLAGEFDIGIASELNKPLNRDICLTNKLFTYIQCGLAVVLSNTSAQKNFIEQHPGIGRLYQDAAELAQILKMYDRDRDLLGQTKIHNFRLGQDHMNWETESKIFLNEVEKCLTQ